MRGRSRWQTSLTPSGSGTLESTGVDPINRSYRARREARKPSTDCRAGDASFMSQWQRRARWALTALRCAGPKGLAGHSGGCEPADNGENVGCHRQRRGGGCRVVCSRGWEDVPVSQRRFTNPNRKLLNGRARRYMPVVVVLVARGVDLDGTRFTQTRTERRCN